MTYPFMAEDLRVLTQWDTPTICNALELLVPERRAIGFTVEPMMALHPGATPIVGLAHLISDILEQVAGASPDPDLTVQIEYGF